MGNTLSNSPQRPKSKFKKLVVIAVTVLVVVTLGSAGLWYASRHNLPFFKRPKDTASKAAAENAPPVAVLQLQSFVVNLADPGQTAFLRVGLALGLSTPLPKSSGSEKDSPFTPQVRDAVLSVLSTWKSEDLLAPDGRKKLKEQLLHILQQRIPELGIVDIYFTDFLIQQ